MYEYEYEEIDMSQFEQLFRQREMLIDLAHVVSALRLEVDEDEPDWDIVHDVVVNLDNGFKFLDHTIP